MPVREEGGSPKRSHKAVLHFGKTYCYLLRMSKLKEKTLADGQHLRMLLSVLCNWERKPATAIPPFSQNICQCCWLRTEQPTMLKLGQY